MIRQSLANIDGILEKKFKILRTSIMLGNLRNREETMAEYEEAAREIDKIRKNVYEELLASKLYTTTSLEDEQERLKNLIEFIENRIQERNDFIDDYIKITSNFLDDLPEISLEKELSEYKIRYDNIVEYFDNCLKIDELNNILKEKRDLLQEKYENKANNEIINSKLEDELIDEFNRIIVRNKYYSELNYVDIDDELVKLDGSLSEKKDVMNTFTSSYEALTNAGISGAEREEYLSYVQDARTDYYNDLEKSFILNIYKLVLDKECDYEKLYLKRYKIDSILNERDRVRRELNINTRNDMEYFCDLFKEQFSIIKSQKFNMEDIDNLIVEIADCESKLEDLENANNRDEIVSLLNEFCVEKTSVEKVELPVEEEIHEQIIKKNEEEHPKAPNMVVRVQEPIKLNVKTASDTAKLVMKKVVVVLEPKKFSDKKDKLKEAELELEERKRKEKILAQEKKLLEEMEQEAKKDENIEILEDVDTDFDDSLDKLDIMFDDKLDDNDPSDIFNDGGVINLDTVEVNEKDVKDTIEIDEFKVNLPDSDELVIPTEIFIEEPKNEKVDLFSETDPFLDDNEFELNDNIIGDEIVSNMPQLKNIGTVKPNSMLSKIEEVSKENDDIILPTMGLVSVDEQGVAIVSENYIN